MSRTVHSESRLPSLVPCHGDQGPGAKGLLQGLRSREEGSQKENHRDLGFRRRRHSTNCSRSGDRGPPVRDTLRTPVCPPLSSVPVRKLPARLWSFPSGPPFQPLVLRLYLHQIGPGVRFRGTRPEGLRSTWHGDKKSRGTSEARVPTTTPSPATGSGRPSGSAPRHQRNTDPTTPSHPHPETHCRGRAGTSWCRVNLPLDPCPAGPHTQPKVCPTPRPVRPVGTTTGPDPGYDTQRPVQRSRRLGGDIPSRYARGDLAPTFLCYPVLRT